MSREIAPTNQWREPNARKVAASPGLLFPAMDDASGVWGWTEVASEAEGIIAVADGVAGVDDSTVIGGARVFDFAGSFAVMWDPPPPPPPRVLDRAIAFALASSYSGSGAWLDESGNGHHAQLGSTAGADANDPTFNVDHFELATDDYFEIADHADLDYALADSLTVLIAIRTATPAQTSAVLTKYNAASGAGWDLQTYASEVNFTVRDGTLQAQDTKALLGAGVIQVIAGRRSVALDQAESFVGGAGSGSPTADITTAALANALPVRIGCWGGTPSGFFTGDVLGYAIFREAVPDADMLLLAAELIA